MAASTQTKPVGRALRRNAWWGGVAVAVAVAAVSLTVDGWGPLFIPAFGIGAASLGLAVTTFLERWQLTRRARRELALLNRERVAGGELAWGPAEMEQYIAAAVGEEISGGWDTPYSGGMPRRRLGYRPGHTRLTRRVLVGGGPEVAALASEVELDLALDRRMRSRGSGPLIDGHTTTVVVQRPSVFGRELGLRLGDEVRAVLRVPMFGWTARGEVAGRAVRIELQQGVIRDDRTGEEIAQLRRGKLLAFDGVAASWKYLGPREGFAFVAQDGQPLLHARLKPGWRRSAELQVDGGMAEWQALVTALVATYLLVHLECPPSTPLVGGLGGVALLSALAGVGGLALTGGRLRPAACLALLVWIQTSWAALSNVRKRRQAGPAGTTGAVNLNGERVSRGEMPWAALDALDRSAAAAIMVAKLDRLTRR